MTRTALDKEKWILAGIATALLFALYFGGRTTPRSSPQASQRDTSHRHEGFDIAAYLDSAKVRLAPSGLELVSAMEKALAGNSDPGRRIAILRDLAAYWRDSARNPIANLWFTGEYAKLENTEKTLNFAAHSYLSELRGESDPELKGWMAAQARSLFKSSLTLNPANDSTTVGFGSTFFFGTPDGGTPMEGILKIREVAERDTTNLFAQFMLGYGGLVSGQYDRAVERFERVLRREPGNMEAIFLMAEACERAGDRKKAVQWYETGRNMIDNPDVKRAINEKIASLQP
jgi:tetratricopeptide (TPR) repeat protein